MSRAEETVRRCLPGLFLASAVLWVFFDLLLGQTLFYSDYSLIYQPLIEWWSQCISSGSWPWWNPAQALGLPQITNPMLGSFYPPFLLLLGFDVIPGLSLLVIGHALLMTSGMYRWVVASGLTTPGALLAASAGLCGAYISSTAYGYMLFAWAWVPWALVAATEDRPLMLAGTTALTTLAGDPLATIASAAMVLGIFYTRENRVWTRLLLSYALAALIAAVQIVPTAYFLPESIRKSGALGSEGLWSMAPDRLVDFWIPGFFGRYAPNMSFWGGYLTDGLSDGNFFFYSLYCGLIPWLVLPAARRSPYRRTCLSLLLFTLGATWLAMGKYGGLYLWIQDVLPGTSLFRYPERWMLLASISLVCLAAFGLPHIQKYDWVIFGIPIGITATAVLFLDDSARDYIALHIADDLVESARKTQIRGAMHVTFCGAAAIAVWSTQRLRIQRAVLLALIALIDVSLAHQSLVWTAEPDVLVAAEPVGSMLSKVSGNASPIVARDAGLDTQRLPRNLDGLRNHVRRNGLTLRANAGSTANIRTLHSESPARLAHSAPPHQWFWFDPVRAAPILGVDFIFVSLERTPNKIASELGSTGAFKWLNKSPALDLGVVAPNRPPLGDVMCADRVKMVETSVSVPDALADHDLRVRAVLEGPPELADYLDHVPVQPIRTCGTARTAPHSPSKTVLEVSLDHRAVVIHRQAFSSGWTWRLEDAVLPTFRAYGSLTASVLPPGQHRIHVEYSTPGFEIGLGGTVIGCLICLLLSLRPRLNDPQQRRM